MYSSLTCILPYVHTRSDWHDIRKSQHGWKSKYSFRALREYCIFQAWHTCRNALSEAFCKPGVMAASRCWQLWHYPDRQAMKPLLKHPRSLICFTMANGNTILYIHTSQFKSLGFPIIPDLGNGAPVEVQGNKCFSLPFLIYLTSTTTIVKGHIIQMHHKRSSTGFMGKSS